jgi:hypothetical protein
VTKPKQVLTADWTKLDKRYWSLAQKCAVELKGAGLVSQVRLAAEVIQKFLDREGV